MKLSNEVITAKDAIAFHWYVVEDGASLIPEGNTIQRTPPGDHNGKVQFTGESLFEERGFYIDKLDLEKVLVREVLYFE